MICQLTSAGQALLEANTGPVTVTSFQLGSAYGYIPEPSDTGIHGTLVYTGTPSSPLAVSANLVSYSSYLDFDLGPFQFGEIGLFVGSVLFALATGSAPISKIPPAAGVSGNAIRIDMYVSVVGTNYAMWLNLAESNNEFQMAVLTSPDLLPQSSQAIPNAYVVSGAVTGQNAFLAYTDKTGLWNFDAYQFGSQVSAPITGSDSRSVTIALSNYSTEMSPAYFGQVILQFTTGTLYSTCRYVQSAIISGEFVTLGFDSMIASQPAVGDTIQVVVRLDDTEVNPIPIATTSQLGGIIVGQYLTIQSNGTLSVNTAGWPYPVTSVSGQTGAVVIQAQQQNSATGTSLITDSGATDGTIKLKNLVAGSNIGLSADANGNIQIANTYNLPVASLSQLGGVKAPSDGNLTISGTGVIDLGFTPVTSVDGQTGAVTLPYATTTSYGLVQIGSGLTVSSGVISVSTTGFVTSVNGATGAVTVEAVDNNPASGLTLISNNGSTTGQIKLKTIVAGTAVTQTTDANGNMQLAVNYATTSTPGSVIVGSGLSIASGVLSVTAAGGVTSVDGQTGVVIVEAIDNNAATGTSLITDSGSTTGVMKFKTIVAGTNVTLAADSNGNMVINGATQTAPVTSVSGQTGAVVVEAIDNSDASGTSLIVASGSSTGVIRLKTIVAGSGITLAADGNGNLQISSGSAYTLPAATTSTLGGVIVGSNLSVTGGGTLSVPLATTTTPGVVTVGSGLAVSAGVLSATGSGVTSFNTRVGAVTFQASDLTGVGGATTTQLAAAKYYDIPGGLSGLPGASQLLLEHVAVRTITWSANFAGSQSYASAAATSSATFNILVNGSVIGTMVFAASATTATFTLSGSATITPGQVLTVVAPASPDATLANVSFTLLGLAT
jgi:hypothetical protein